MSYIVAVTTTTGVTMSFVFGKKDKARERFMELIGNEIILFVAVIEIEGKVTRVLDCYRNTFA